MTKKKTILFFHPDLGIGGAERLIIDAAVGLQKRGHKVVVFTSHCDPKHCFEEARDGILDVRVRGNWLVPPSILSRFSIICAILRQAHLILETFITFELRKLSPDVFMVDQLSAGLPWLYFLYPSTQILFYCHFPDLLLAQGRKSWWKCAYRLPFDFLEAWSMNFADTIVVNSAFTRGIVSKVFPSLVKSKQLRIVYPSVTVKEKNIETTAKDLVPPWQDRKIILSINRFERKKNIELAIKAFSALGKEARKNARLVLAGGYDHRVRENVEYHKQLLGLAETSDLKTATTKTIVSALNVPDDIDILFLLSVPSTLKDLLLKTARLLVYTPSNEHFGLVPLEAMLAGLPVLAADTGGPLETVLNGKTGWLRDPEDVESWTDVMDDALNGLSNSQLANMGKAGVARVKKEFSDTKMAETLDEIIRGMADANDKRRTSAGVPWFSVTVILFVIDATYYYVGRDNSVGRIIDTLHLPAFAVTFVSAVLGAGYFGLYRNRARSKQ